MKLIDKDRAIAEIDKVIADETESLKSFEHGRNISEVQRSNARIDVLTHISSLLNTLEVKEVDEQQERMNECPYRQVGCQMYEGHILECTGACGWVVDYLKLKNLKNKKDKYIIKDGSGN